MIICPNCNKQLEDGTAFCDNCGTQIVAPQAPVVDQAPVQQPYAPAYEAVAVEEPQAGKKFNKKLIALGGAAVAVVLVLAIVLSSLVFGGKASYPYAFYIKDGEMFYSKTGKIKPIQATISLDDTGDRTNASYAERGYSIADYVTISHDGDTLFYGDKEDSKGNFALYFRPMNDTKKDPVKIDSSVDEYVVSINGKLVTYTNNEGNLYQYNVKKQEKEKIASDVTSFRVSDDGDRIYFVTTEGEGEKAERILNYKKSGKDKEKIQGELGEEGRVVFYSEDFKTVYYLQCIKGEVKEGESYANCTHDLYMKKEGKDKQKIAADVSNVYVYESGEIYYKKSSDDKKSYYDFVEDDAQGTYQYLKESEISFDKICYYDGKKEIVLSNTGYYIEECAEEATVAVYTNVDEGKIGKVNPANLEEGTSVSDAIYKKIEEATQYVLAVEDKTSVIDLTDIHSVKAISEDGKLVYLSANYKEGEYNQETYETIKAATYDVYEMKVSGGKAKKPEKYDTDVNEFELAGEDTLITKERKDNKFDLYVNKNKVASDVCNIEAVSEDNIDALVYFTDYSEEKKTVTAHYYNGKKSVKISDDVASCEVNPNGDVLYLKDYNNDTCKGDLYVFTGKKSEKIDIDVTCIVPFEDKYADK